ncbi:MAG: hypothetical protein JWQ35_2345, partial [Bacteriovoracaceae bacterium]|nr:hypothetical protein [Bacteriovoracaceae bacterium]
LLPVDSRIEQLAQFLGFFTEFLNF